MKTHHRILFLALPIVLGVCVWIVLRPEEPEYQGKPLSVWLEGYNFPRARYEESWREADVAVRQTGTNAIPTLLAMLRLSDSSPWQRRLLDLLDKQHFIKVQHVHPWAQNWRAATAFKALGSAGRNAVPELIELYEKPRSAPSQRYTAYALGNIGPSARQAIPSLLQVLKSPSETEAKVAAIGALGQIHGEPGLVVPRLIECLTNNPTEVESEAADALGNFRSEAGPAVRALIEMVGSAGAGPRDHAINALKQIAPEAVTKAGVN